MRRIAFNVAGLGVRRAELFPTPENALSRPDEPLRRLQAGRRGLIALTLTGFGLPGLGSSGGLRSWASVIHARPRVRLLQEAERADRRRSDLGDGRQRKSYLYVQDCIDVMLLAVEKAGAAQPPQPGPRRFCHRRRFAELDLRHLKLSPRALQGGTRGWIGDSPFILWTRSARAPWAGSHASLSARGSSARSSSCRQHWPWRARAERRHAAFATYKNVLVTGASRGLGLELARSLARAGAHLALAARDYDALVRAAEDVRAARANDKQRVMAWHADLSRDEDVERLAEGCLKGLGRIDALVNNAAVQGPIGALERVETDAARHIQVTCRPTACSSCAAACARRERQDRQPLGRRRRPLRARSERLRGVQVRAGAVERDARPRATRKRDRVNAVETGASTHA